MWQIPMNPPILSESDQISQIIVNPSEFDQLLWIPLIPSEFDQMSQILNLQIFVNLCDSSRIINLMKSSESNV